MLFQIAVFLIYLLVIIIVVEGLDLDEIGGFQLIVLFIGFFDFVEIGFSEESLIGQ